MPAQPEPQPAMQAALICRHGEAPEYRPHPVPRRAAGQALIRVLAAPIAPLDLLCASGTSYFGPPPLPYAPGVQGVGIVEDADTLPGGQRVWFSCDAGMKPGDGAMAQFCVADESAVLAVPDGVGDGLVAALGLSAIAAWMALTWRGRLQPGEHVLVLGASGIVGQVGVQAARLLGAERVTAACRDPAGRARAMKLGADAAADATGDDVDAIAARLRGATAGRVDLVLDPVWGRPAEAAMRVISPHGRLVNLGSSAGPLASFASAALRSGMQSVIGYTNNALSYQQKTEALGEILRHAGAGRLTVDHQSMPLERAADGWASTGRAPYRRTVLIP